MRGSIRSIGFFWILTILSRPWANALEIDPLYKFQLLGGQYFFKGDKSAFTGNASALVAPAFRLNERWSMLPTLSSAYQGTKQVIDLVGAGSLFQEQMDHRVGMKAIYQSEGSLWRLKPNLGYRAQLLKETKNEDWTRGLFDYQAANAGFEAEYVYREPFSLRMGYDFAYTFFPNYTSLESRAGSDFAGQQLARELATDRVLDTLSHIAALTLTVPLGGRLFAESNALFLYQSYPNQRVVDAAGSLTSIDRQDFVTTLNAGLRMPAEIRPHWRALGSLEAGWRNVVSNQNNYDARNTRFFPGYYTYSQISAGPQLKMFWGSERQPISFSLGTHWIYRSYPHRLTQNAAGTYQSDSLDQHSWMLASTLSYPMAAHFNLIFNVQHGGASSNQRFEQFYSYNYNVTNYLFGFSYDY